MKFLELFLILYFYGISTISCRGLQEEFTWTRINFEWPSGRNRQPSGNGNIRTKYSSDGIQFVEDTNEESSSYIYENNIPMGANFWNNKLFITIPRRRPGVPSTLNYVWANSTQRHHNVPLIPYPDWNTNTYEGSRGNGDKFVSVYRVAVDSCDRLWFVDTGRIETPGNQQQVQPTALVIMDLRTDRIIRRHVFNSTVLLPNTNLASVTVDITNEDCQNAFAYMPDLAGYGLVVYSLKDDKAWRVTHNYFYLEPQAGEFRIGGHEFQWNDGIFSIALSDVKSDGFKDAYFHSMAGYNLYKVSTKILRDEALATRSYHGRDFEVVGNKGELSQTSTSAMHASRGILFLGLINQNALGCWNVKTPLSDISIIQKDKKKMIYPSDVKVCNDYVVVLTNNMPVFLYGTLNYDEVNFRVWVETIDRAVQGTKCAGRKRSRH